MTSTDHVEAALADKKNGNGNHLVTDLPEPRQHAFAQGLAEFHTVAAKCESLNAEIERIKASAREEIARLKSDIAAHKVTTEAQAAQVSEAKSREMIAYSVRDEQIAEAEKYKTICRSIQAVLRAHEVSNEPLIAERREADDEMVNGGA